MPETNDILLQKLSETRPLSSLPAEAPGEMPPSRDKVRSLLDRTVLAHVDLIEQPSGTHYLVLDVGPIHNYQVFVFSVDRIEADETQVRAFLGDTCVVAFSPSISWYAVQASYTEPLTMREMMTRNARDNRASADLQKELYPSEAEVPESGSPGQYV